MTSSEIVNLEVVLPGRAAEENEWYPLLLVIRRPDFWKTGVLLRNISTQDRDVQLNLDLLNREVPVRPGETLRMTLPIRVTRSKDLALDSIEVQIHECDADRKHDIQLP